MCFKRLVMNWLKLSNDNIYVHLNKVIPASNQLSENQWMRSWYCLFCHLLQLWRFHGLCATAANEFVSPQHPLVEAHEIALTWIKVCRQAGGRSNATEEFHACRFAFVLVMFRAEFHSNQTLRSFVWSTRLCGIVLADCYWLANLLVPMATVQPHNEVPPYLTVGLSDLWDATSVDHRVDCRVGMRQENTWGKKCICYCEISL